MTIPTACPQKSRPLGCPLDWPGEIACYLAWIGDHPACTNCAVVHSRRDPTCCRANVAEDAPACLWCHIGQEIVRLHGGKRRADAARSSRP
jgi:hypothetical protein